MSFVILNIVKDLGELDASFRQHDIEYICIDTRISHNNMS